MLQCLQCAKLSVSLLLPAMYWSRNKQKNSLELDLSSWLNTVLYLVMRCEAFGIKYGINFSLGGSRLVVAQKK